MLLASQEEYMNIVIQTIIDLLLFILKNIGLNLINKYVFSQQLN